MKSHTEYLAMEIRKRREMVHIRVNESLFGQCESALRIPLLECP
jgi:hypothetical protein